MIEKYYRKFIILKQSQFEVMIMERGRVKIWFEGKGYGFIRSQATGDEIFFHRAEIMSDKDVVEGQKVEFEVERTSQGLKAVDVRLVG
ncbi:MAG: cold-shock protein [Thermoplasmatota archaeon]